MAWTIPGTIDDGDHWILPNNMHDRAGKVVEGPVMQQLDRKLPEAFTQHILKIIQ